MDWSHCLQIVDDPIMYTDRLLSVVISWKLGCKGTFSAKPCSHRQKHTRVIAFMTVLVLIIQYSYWTYVSKCVLTALLEQLLLVSYENITEDLSVLWCLKWNWKPLPSQPNCIQERCKRTKLGSLKRASELVCLISPGTSLVPENNWIFLWLAILYFF